MSHDRGCPCGKEPYEYDECRKASCTRNPLNKKEAAPMSANSTQIGGSHYAATLQHWDVVEGHGIGYLEAAATKYVTRWRKKNGRQDLEKARHYTIKLMELFNNGLRLPRGIVPLEKVVLYNAANGLTPTEGKIMELLFRWETFSDLFAAEGLIVQLMDEVP